MTRISGVEKMIMDVNANDLKREHSCNVCGGKLYYMDSGKHFCKSCGHIEEDDTIKLKKFFRNNRDSLIYQITKETGVELQKITNLLDRLENELLVEEETHLKCERCGCSIFSGRFCSS